MLKSSLKKAITYSNMDRISRRFYGGIGLILNFHRVVPKSKKSRFNGSIEVAPEYLEDCISYFMKNNYDVVSLDRIYQILKQREIVKRNFVSFTFDDGFSDNFDFAFPIFKKHALPFTLYVSTSFIDGIGFPWWYLIEHAIQARQSINFESDGISINCKCLTDRDKVNAHLRLEHFFKNNIITSDLVEQFCRQNKIDLEKLRHELMLSWSQIKLMSEYRSATIAPHTVNHYALNMLEPEEVREEISNSKKKLEARLGLKMEHFSYPFGEKHEVGEREFAIVRDMGFKTATTTRCGNIFYEHSDYLDCLPRIRAGEDHSFSVLASGILPAINNNFKRIITD